MPFPIIGSRLAVYHGSSGEALDSGVGAPGIELLAADSITVPVRAIDLSLPADYDHFCLTLNNIYLEPGPPPRYLTAAFSQDGGDTWICDPVNYDSYISLLYRTRGNFVTDAATLGTDILADTLLDAISPDYQTGERIWGASSPNIMIMPGDDETYAQAFAPAGFNLIASDLSNIVIAQSWSGINPEATVPIPKRRVNAIRLADWGVSGDFNNLDGADITAGSYRLWGVR